MMLSPRLREADAGEFPASLLEVLQERSWHPSVGFYPANRLPLRLMTLWCPVQLVSDLYLFPYQKTSCLVHTLSWWLKVHAC